MYGDRQQMRQRFLDVFERLAQGAEASFDALERQIAAVIQEHPEYHALFADRERALAAEFPPEAGQSNPFLHLAMHLGIREQVATDRPAGIADLHRRLCARHGVMDAEHRMIECLGLALWEAQRAGRLPDERAYLDCLARLA